LNANVDALGVRAQVRVIALPIERALRGLQTGQEARFDLVLADPPYAEVENGAATTALETLVVPHMTRGALLVLEHASRDAAPAIANLEHEDARKYGDTTLSFYTCARDA
jgi:16S rRNA G966 N2-methylase RsmD